MARLMRVTFWNLFEIGVIKSMKRVPLKKLFFKPDTSLVWSNKSRRIKVMPFVHHRRLRVGQDDMRCTFFDCLVNRGFEDEAAVGVKERVVASKFILSRA